MKLTCVAVGPLGNDMTNWNCDRFTDDALLDLIRVAWGLDLYDTAKVVSFKLDPLGFQVAVITAKLVCGNVMTYVFTA